MAKSAKPNEPPKVESAKAKTSADKAKRPKPQRDTEDDFEDGDIATPKRDRYGNDDEPL